MSPVRAMLTLIVLGTVLALTTACGQQVAGEPKAADNLVAVPRSSKPQPQPPSSRRPISTARPPTSAASSAADRLAGLTGSWEGEYTCAQGVTGLRLLIDRPQGETLPATFVFYGLPDNPTAKEGAYAILGSFNASGQLVFKQQRWINQPEGYVMVDIAVTSPIEADVEQLSGDVLIDSCKGFSVRRR
jgi:hypothetical protein